MFASGHSSETSCLFVCLFVFQGSFAYLLVGAQK